MGKVTITLEDVPTKEEPNAIDVGVDFDPPVDPNEELKGAAHMGDCILNFLHRSSDRMEVISTETIPRGDNGTH